MVLINWKPKTFLIITAIVLFLLATPLFAQAFGTHEGEYPDCAACHTSHAANSGFLLNGATQKITCYKCHDGQGDIPNVRDQFGEETVGNSIYASYHPVPDNSLLCSSCHEPHRLSTQFPQILGAGANKASSGNAVCGTCHGEKSSLSGGDMVTDFVYTPHDVGMPNPLSGTEIKCAKCHEPHGSPYKPLIRQRVENKGQLYDVTGNDNSLCYGCHQEGTRNYKGKDVYSSSKHGSVDTPTVALTVYPGTDYSAGMCLNCHEPHGKTGNSDYKRAAENNLCVKCHDDESIIRPDAYSYRGISTYVNTPHSTAAGPSQAATSYNANSQGFQVWRGLSDQTPQNPGTPVSRDELSKLLNMDESWLITEAATLEGDLNTQMYKFTVTEPVADLNELKVTWVGYGEFTPEHPTEISLWNLGLNGGAGGWEKIESRQLGADETITIVQGNVSDYVNANGEVYVLAGAVHDGTGPAVSNFKITALSTSSVRISWNTNEAAKSSLNYGTTPAYGYTVHNSTYKNSHSFDLTGLSKHTLYHYEALSNDAFGNSQNLGDQTFVLSDPPNVPTLVPQTDIVDEASSITVNLVWNTVDDINGDPVQYQVQVSTSSSFSGIPYQSDWMDDGGGTTQSWTVTLPNSTNYYWRVKARDKTHTLMESVSSHDAFELKASCPILYTWDGEKYTFVSDVMGLGTLGLPQGQGKYRYPPPVEETKIDRNLLKPENGKYRMVLKNDLNEIEFVDRLLLKVVDHPVGTEIFINDFTRANLPIDPVKIYTTRNLQPVKNAKYVLNPLYKGNYKEQDITEQVKEIDYEYAPASLFDDNQYILDLGDLSQAQEIKLVVSGWSKFASIAERQEWLDSGMPKAERAMDVMGPAGEWIKVIDDLPYIPGLTKSAVYDLTGLFPEGVKEYKVRLRGLPQTYFDYFAIDTSKNEAVKVQELSPSKADLQYQGRSAYEEKPEPFFDYYTQSGGSRIYHEGNFTRYGDVIPLLERTDDMFVIMDSGDAITLEFDEVPVQPGMTRSYIFFADGYFQERTGKVEPMPFHAMSNYPYPETEKYPDGPEHKKYLAEWNTRVHPPKDFSVNGSTNEVENLSLQRDFGLWEKTRLLFVNLLSWITDSLSAAFARETINKASPEATKETSAAQFAAFSTELPQMPHYSLNANYIELEVKANIPSGNPGSCTLCHAVHGNSGVPSQLKAEGEKTCFANGFGCHSEPSNSALGINIQEKFTGLPGPTSRHSVDFFEQLAYGTKVECINCHNPHLNDAESKTVNPENRYEIEDQWIDRGVSKYVYDDGSIYIMAKAKHDGTPPVITGLTHTVDNVASSATVYWYTDEKATREVEYGFEVGNYVYSTPNTGLFYSSPHSGRLENLEVGVDYHYRVKTEDALGNLRYSEDRVVRLSSPPEAPSNLRHSPDPLPSWNYTENVRLEWDPPNEPDGDPMQYYVEISGASPSGWLPVGQTWWDTSVSNYNSQDYSWRVKAKDVYGAEGPYSTYATFTHVGETWTPSCPIYYAWDGEKFEFVTDVVDASVGLKVGPDKYANVRPDLPIVIPGNLLKADGGKYTISVKNEEDEIDFHDAFELQVVDHPVGTKIDLNHLVRETAPYKIYTYNEKVKPIKKASYVNNPVYSGGNKTAARDITELVSAVDNKHASGQLFDDNIFTFDLGDLSDAETIKMVLVGWTEYAYSDEKKERLEKVSQGYKTAKNSLEILQPDGSWKTETIKHMPGHTKTSILDLTGKFPTGTEKYIIRLRGMLRPHLDFVGIDTSSQRDTQVTTLKPVEANLRYGGIAERELSPSPYYDYYKKMDQTIQHKGNFTRYGDVLPLVNAVDDKLVVMDTGDELIVNFNALSPPAPGFTRSFVVKPWNYYKELDLAQVEPIPFRGMDMSKLPDSLGEYPEHLREYVEEWNTREHNPDPAIWERVLKKLQSLIEKAKNLLFEKKAPDLAANRKKGLREPVEPVEPSHYSLNTDYLALGIGTPDTSKQYLPNSSGVKVWEKGTLPTFESPGNEVIDGLEKDKASSVNNVHLSTDLVSEEGAYNYQMFKFKVSEAVYSINRLSVNWLGYGEPTPDHETAIYIWDFSANAWQEIGSGQYGSITKLTMFKNKENSTFCNKCHDNVPPEGALMGVVPPANISASVTNDFHGDFPGTTENLAAPYVSQSSRLACDDCHDPHGSSNAYHLRETVNAASGTTLIQEDGTGAEGFCRSCHTGSLLDTWHAQCKVCHGEGYVDHGYYPDLTEGLISNCFRCHGHNKDWYEHTSCSSCHGSTPDHYWTKTF